MLPGLVARIRGKTGAAAPLSGSTARLRQLDHEVDQERALQVSAATLGFIGAILSVTVSSVFALLPAFVFATLGQYAVQGWCLPMALLARLGLRSSRDIDCERYALAATIEEPPQPALDNIGAD